MSAEPELKTSVAEMGEERLRELAEDPRNIVYKPRADQTMDVLRSSAMLRLLRRTRVLFTIYMNTFPHHTKHDARDAICAIHRDAAECRIRYPLLFLTMTTDDLPPRPLHGIKMMIRAFEAYECGILDSEDDAMQFFFAAVLPHSFRPEDVLAKLKPMQDTVSSPKERMLHDALMENIRFMQTIDSADGFTADVETAGKLRSIPRRMRKVVRTLGLKDRVSSDERWEGRRAIQELAEGCEPWQETGKDGRPRARTQVGPFYSYNTIPSSFMFTLNVISSFYSDERNLREMRDLVERATPDSPPMRLLDWLVTNFSKENSKIIEIRSERNELIRVFDIHSEYKRQRSECKKRLFDCFAKRLRICYNLDGRLYTTTVAQANFIQWAIRNKIIEYAKAFRNEINDHMNRMKSKRVYEKKHGIVTKQRSSLSKRSCADVFVADSAKRARADDESTTGQSTSMEGDTEESDEQEPEEEEPEEPEGPEGPEEPDGPEERGQHAESFNADDEM